MAGVAATVISLTLTVRLIASPDWFGLSSSPELFEQVEDRGRGSEGFIFLWAWIAIPVAGLLQTPIALVRGARIGTGWALATAYWLYTVLLAAPVWLAQGLFPESDGPGKSGGMFGAVILLALSTPVFAVASGTVFRTGPHLAEQLRRHVTGAAALSFAFSGVFAGLMTGAAFRFPREGSFAMILPGRVLWGFLAGAAVGTLVGATLQTSPESRRTMIADAAGMARTGTAVLACCLCVSQLGWFLPGFVVMLLGLAAPIVLLMQAHRSERLGRWLEFKQLDIPKDAFA